MPSGEHLAVRGASSRFLRSSGELRRGASNLGSRRHGPPTAEVRAFRINPDPPPRAVEDPAQEEQAERLTQERDRAREALTMLEQLLSQVEQQVITVTDERDWARRNLRIFEEEVITLRGKESTLNDEVERLRLDFTKTKEELTRLQTAAETRPEGDDWGWDDRADIALEVSRLKEDLELSISDRDNALEARDALARQALMAGIQRSKFPVSGGKKWLNFALMVALLTGLAFFGKCFPSLIPGLEESGALPPEVQVRKEIVVPAADKTTKTEGTE